MLVRKSRGVSEDTLVELRPSIIQYAAPDYCNLMARVKIYHEGRHHQSTSHIDGGMDFLKYCTVVNYHQTRINLTTVSTRPRPSVEVQRRFLGAARRLSVPQYTLIIGTKWKM